MARMCFGNKIGFRFQDAVLEPHRLFAPESGAILVELAEDTSVEDLPFLLFGRTIEQPQVELGEHILPLDRLIAAWNGTLDRIFPTAAPDVEIRDIPLCRERSGAAPAVKAAKPRVFIPVFPGTNCEYDSARAFERAGAEPEVLVVQNRTPGDIEETIRRMAEAISRAQIVMIPGGFSGGDEPDGSGKFIATAFRNPRVSTAVEDLLQRLSGADQTGAGPLRQDHGSVGAHADFDV